MAEAVMLCKGRAGRREQRREFGRECREVEDWARDRRVWNPGWVKRRKDGGRRGGADETKGREDGDGGASSKRGVRGEANLGTSD